jgi:hypothetical protein
VNEHLIRPEPPDELTAETRAFWREVGRSMVRDSLGTIDGTARQVIAVAGVLEGLYFHAIAYSDLRGQVSGGQWVVYLLPVLLLLLSLVAALLVFLPDRYRVNIHAAQASRLVYERVVGSKLRMLRVASLFLVLGVAAIVWAVGVYLGG